MINSRNMTINKMASFDDIKPGDFVCCIDNPNEFPYPSGAYYVESIEGDFICSYYKPYYSEDIVSIKIHRKFCNYFSNEVEKLYWTKLEHTEQEEISEMPIHKVRKISESEAAVNTDRVFSRMKYFPVMPGFAKNAKAYYRVD